MRVDGLSLQGLRQAESQLDRVARRIAGVESQGPEADTVSISPEGLARAGGDHAADLVELRSTRLAFGANVRVLAGARDAIPRVGPEGLVCREPFDGPTWREPRVQPSLHVARCA